MHLITWNGINGRSSINETAGRESENGFPALFFMLFIFCIYDICHIPSAVKNTDHGNGAAAIIHSVVHNKVIYRDFVHSHTFPRFPIYKGIPGWHEVKGTDSFPYAVDLFFGSLRNHKRESNVRVDFLKSSIASGE